MSTAAPHCKLSASSARALKKLPACQGFELEVSGLKPWSPNVGVIAKAKADFGFQSRGGQNIEAIDHSLRPLMRIEVPIATMNVDYQGIMAFKA